MQTVFDLRNVSYTYLGKFPALKDVTLRIDAGEHVAIMGANGSGKSTLLSILNALAYPTEGEFYAFGSPVTEEVFDSLEDNEQCRYFRKKVGFVFQNPDVQLFCSTVYDEVAFGPLQLDLSKEEVKKRTEDVLAMVGITGLRDRSPHTISGGEKKKVCLASVLSVNPDVLLLDEPTAGLDPRSQLWLIELLQELAHAGKTIVTATHDLDIIEQISTRAVVFGEDHMLKVDTDSHKVMADLELLKQHNLIHRHMHRHGNLEHQHLHSHDKEHTHEHIR
ncbi:putative cobalt ABC transporter ATP binding protein [Methanocella paludicola SANAE]|uniref:Cobalt ABC transporter ATP binding protein n=1 Tax=Methanocella paludicola (strain DSM 17711 / JCM 13418 / NBRC 101707 / SANAE) TaxID=304371 RepID=D1YXI3_METPS|nr:ABC transporter ATP-binding protein [Methanocella paludicola]BAI61155.1 putative cobalt ABC transporter ATP binding protein [Methanocella paludicola SANAE]